MSYRNQCTVVAKSIFNAKSAYYSSKVLKRDKNVKALSQIKDMLIKNNHQIALPTTYNPKELPAKFQDFFKDKINRLREDFNTDLHTDNHYNPIQILHVL